MMMSRKLRALLAPLPLLFVLVACGDASEAYVETVDTDAPEPPAEIVEPEAETQR